MPVVVDARPLSPGLFVVTAGGGAVVVGLSGDGVLLVDAGVGLSGVGDVGGNLWLVDAEAGLGGGEGVPIFEARSGREGAARGWVTAVGCD